MADPFMEATEAVHTCVCTELNLLLNPPGECCIFVGSDQEFLASLNQDRCCSGIGYVRISSYAPVTVFPEAQAVWRNCAPDQWVLMLELGVVRCAPTGTASNLASCAEELAFARQVMDDAAALRRAILCCWKPGQPAGRQFVLGGWEAFGPQGMCGGGKMSLQIQVTCQTDCLAPF